MSRKLVSQRSAPPKLVSVPRVGISESQGGQVLLAQAVFNVSVPRVGISESQAETRHINALQIFWFQSRESGLVSRKHSAQHTGLALLRFQSRESGLVSRKIGPRLSSLMRVKLFQSRESGLVSRKSALLTI